MEKKVMKQIYNFYHNRDLSTREVKQKIKEHYKVLIKETDVVLISGEKEHPSKIPKAKRKLLLSLYQKSINTEKLLYYFSERHGVNITRAALNSIASKEGIKKKFKNSYWQKTIGPKEEFEIIELYKKGVSTIEIADRYGFKTRKSITDILKRHREKIIPSCEKNKSKKSYKDFSFKEIDSPEKAYFLGLLLSDGYVDTRYNRIGLDLVDKDAIEFISESFDIPFNNVDKNNSNGRNQNRFRIVMFGEEHYEGAARLGLVDRKTLTLAPPVLTESEKIYIPYILRGLLDGDGWIRKDGKEFFLVSASIRFIHWFMERLTDLGMKNLKVTEKFDEKSHNPVYLVRSGYQYNIKILKKEIYDKPMGMKRKFNRLYQIKEDLQRL